MSIWIRSQCGKRLEKTDYVCIWKPNEAHEIHSNNCHLGSYPTEAQAMKVLDEIHEVLELCADGVFIMPPAKEEES
jgi:hypothetical protein